MKVLAFDFGASSGRAILGIFENGRITLEELHRFENVPVFMNGNLYWDLPRLFSEIKQGLQCAEKYEYTSIGIDTWGVDYGLVTKEGWLLANPYHYRDQRTENLFQHREQFVSDIELYSQTGIQLMHFNTLFQLLETKQNNPGVYDLADKLILMPDLFGYLLTGEVYAERSMASTTQLLEPYAKEWNDVLIDRAGLKRSMFPKLVESGTKIGCLKHEICEELGIAPRDVIAAAGHDTASAVAAVPAKQKDFVYISCGTWSLFGTELEKPCITPEAAEMNFTNEAGYGGTTRFLKNIIGLWLIQETRRQFHREGKPYSYADMEQMAREAEPFQYTIDPDDERFIPPGNQIERIKQFCRETGQHIPQTDGEIVRCIYESLARRYQSAYESLMKITGKTYGEIHIVGGGAQDGFLCQLTADFCGVPVIAGPVEATAAGNIAVQLIAAGEIKDLKEARGIISKSFAVKTYLPGGKQECVSRDCAGG